MDKNEMIDPNPFDKDKYPPFDDELVSSLKKNTIKPLIIKEQRRMNYPKITITGRETLVKELTAMLLYAKGPEEKVTILNLIVKIEKERAVLAWVKNAEKCVKDSKSVVLKRFFKKILLDNIERK